MNKVDVILNIWLISIVFGLVASLVMFIYLETTKVFSPSYWVIEKIFKITLFCAGVLYGTLAVIVIVGQILFRAF